MATLKAYFDDSERNVITFSGYLGTADQWEDFELRWDRLLKLHSIPYFHMKEFAPSVGAFSSWKDDENRRRELVQDICAMIDGLGVRSVSASLDCSTIRVREGEKFDELPLAVAVCMRELLGLTWKPQGLYDSVECICDRMDDPFNIQAKAEEYILRSHPKVREWWQSGCVTITPLRKEDSWREIRPIQIADFLAWESRNGAEIKLGYKQQGGHWSGDRVSAVSLAMASGGNSRMYSATSVEDVVDNLTAKS
jgi:hypothetical protein